MANQALIRGAADVAPKFVDYGKSFSDSFNKVYQEGAKLAQDTKDAELKIEEAKAEDIRNMASVDTQGLTDDIAGAVQGRALEIKDKYFDIINRKTELGPLQFAIEQKKLDAEISEINALVISQKQFGSDSAEAMKLGVAPYGDDTNFNNVKSLVDTRVKKTLGKTKDGKMVWQTEDGTQINPFNLKPLETVDFTVGVKYENSLKNALKTNSLNQKSLSADVIKEQTALQLSQLSEPQVKSLAVHYGLGGLNPKEYFGSSDINKIKEDIKESAVNRVTGFAEDLNESKKPTQAATKSPFGAALTDELTANKYNVSRIRETANILGEKMEGKNIESKMKIIYKELQKFDNNPDVITRGMAYNRFVKQQKAAYDELEDFDKKEAFDPYSKDEKAIKKLRSDFKQNYGKSQFYAKKDMAPIEFDTSNPDAIFEFLINNSNLSDKAKEVNKATQSPAAQAAALMAKYAKQS